MSWRRIAEGLVAEFRKQMARLFDMLGEEFRFRSLTITHPYDAYESRGMVNPAGITFMDNIAILVRHNAFSSVTTCTLNVYMLKIEELVSTLQRLENSAGNHTHGFPYTLRNLCVNHRHPDDDNRALSRVYPTRLLGLSRSIENLTVNHINRARFKIHVSPRTLIADIVSVKRFELRGVTMGNTSLFTLALQSFPNLTRLQLCDIQKKWSYASIGTVQGSRWGMDFQDLPLRWPGLTSIILETLSYDGFIPRNRQYTCRFCIS